MTATRLAELDQLLEEVARISDTTEFNQRKLLDGTASLYFQVGANKGQGINLSIGDASATAPVSASLDTVLDSANLAISLPDAGAAALLIAYVEDAQARLGVTSQTGCYAEPA